MKTYYIEPPVGMLELKKAMIELNKNKKGYQYGSVKIPHFIIKMDEGNGFSTAVEFITEFLFKNKMKPFNNLLPYIEIKLEDYCSNLKKNIEKVNAAAVFTSEYDGIIACNFFEATYLQGEEEYNVFLDFIKTTGKTATFIFFHPNRGISRAEKEFLHEIMKALNDNVMYIDLKPYSASEKSKIITRYLQGDLGIVVESSIEKSLQRYLTINNSINTAKDCVKYASNLALIASYDKLPPVLTTKQFSKHLNEREKNKEEVFDGKLDK